MDASVSAPVDTPTDAEDILNLHLTTTIMPLPTRCAKLRHMCDVLEAWWTHKRCPWRKGLLRTSSSSSSTSVQHQQPTLALPPAIFSAAGTVQQSFDEHMRKRSGNTCRTLPLTLKQASQLVVGIGYELTGPLTCGGMSRIFSTTSPKVLVKISDMSRGWSRYEMHGYTLLQKHNLPTARVLTAVCRQGYMIIAVERLDCTVSSLINSVAIQGGLYIDELTRGLQHLLGNLRLANITFGDLSPDNIMLRGTDMVLIDPQFAVPTSALILAGMGASWAAAFDTVHLSLKILAIGVMSKNTAVKQAAQIMCCALLQTDTPPSPEHMHRWLLNDVPRGLRMAYTALHTSEMKRRRKKTKKRKKTFTKIYEDNKHPEKNTDTEGKGSLLSMGMGKQQKSQ